jgi:large subunit ribosomal protein L23
LSLTMPTKIIIKPVITEKSMILAPKGQFTFFVSKLATKSAISIEIENLFKVDVVKVRLANKPGKPKKTGKKRIAVKTKKLRKAIITLKPGQSIDYFKLPDEKQSKAKKTKESIPNTPKASKDQASKTKQKTGLLGQLRKITTIKQPE